MSALSESFIREGREETRSKSKRRTTVCTPDIVWDFLRVPSRLSRINFSVFIYKKDRNEHP